MVYCSQTLVDPILHWADKLKLKIFRSLAILLHFVAKCSFQIAFSPVWSLPFPNVTSSSQFNSELMHQNWIQLNIMTGFMFFFSHHCHFVSAVCSFVSTCLHSLSYLNFGVVMDVCCFIRLYALWWLVNDEWCTDVQLFILRWWMLVLGTTMAAWDSGRNNSCSLR
jgi:hypothetical protein